MVPVLLSSRLKDFFSKFLLRRLIESDSIRVIYEGFCLKCSSFEPIMGDDRSGDGSTPYFPACDLRSRTSRARTLGCSDT